MKANSHPTKLVFQPTQSLELLRFVLDSILIRVTMTVARVGKILALCGFFLTKRLFTIRHVTSLIETHVSTFPGVELGPLHYRRLERDKDIALRNTLDDFEGLMFLSLEGIEDLNWWIVSLTSANRSNVHGVPDVTHTSGASLRGWGTASWTACTHDLWSEAETTYHINVLELPGSGIRS